ncbi:MAG: hypothetical protein ABI742_05355, partial [Gemmatimonadota bacterium]
TTNANGLGRLVAELDGAADTLFLRVQQRGADLRPFLHDLTLNKVGVEASIAVAAYDRNGVHIAQPVIDWATDDSGVLEVSRPGVVRALRAGTSTVRVSADGLSVLIRVVVRQVPARIQVVAPIGPIPLTGSQTLGTTVFDSNGHEIDAPAISWTVSDPAIGQVVGDQFLPRLPGRTFLNAVASPASITLPVQVVGLAVSVNGIRLTAPGPVAPNGKPVISNGLIRLQIPGLADQQAGMLAEILNGPRWLPFTSTSYGDYVYVASSVQTGPTGIELLEISDTIIAIRYDFGNHQVAFDHLTAPFDYPFSRTVWLRAGDHGYFTQVTIHHPPPETRDFEHELGFGGLFGPATIRFGNAATLRTDTLSSTVRIQPEATIPDAADFWLDTNPLQRVLVPLPGNELISPVFGSNAGSVYIHQVHSRDYGAYLFVGPRTSVVTARSVCAYAWAHAPFPLPPISAAELAACGPN